MQIFSFLIELKTTYQSRMIIINIHNYVTMVTRYFHREMHSVSFNLFVFSTFIQTFYNER